MRHHTAVADAAPADTPAPYATTWPVPPLESLLARMDRAGAGALDDHELLALVGVGVDAATLAAAGGLRGVFDDPADRLCAVLSSRAKTARGCAPCSSSTRGGWRRISSARRPSPRPRTPRATSSRGCAGGANEVFAAVFLDNRHRVIAFEELFHGTVDGASVHPRVVARRALVHNAAALIACHNHPSGVAEPSRADRAITARLRDALALVDVRLLDHFVVGDGEVVSFAERGWL